MTCATRRPLASYTPTVRSSGTPTSAGEGRAGADRPDDTVTEGRKPARRFRKFTSLLPSLPDTPGQNSPLRWIALLKARAGPRRIPRDALSGHTITRPTRARGIARAHRFLQHEWSFLHSTASTRTTRRATASQILCPRMSAPALTPGPGWNYYRFTLERGRLTAMWVNPLEAIEC